MNQSIMNFLYAVKTLDTTILSCFEINAINNQSQQPLFTSLHFNSNHFAMSGTNNDDSNATNLTSLPEKIQFHVFSYLLKDDVLVANLFNYRFGKDSTPGICKIYKELGTVSKSFHASILRYIQITPLTLSCEFSGSYERLWWAFMNSAHLKDLQLYANGMNSAMVSALIAKCCNLYRLETLRIYAATCRFEGDFGTLENALDGGFDERVFYMWNDCFTNLDEFQQYLSLEVPHKAYKLKTLHITTSCNLNLCLLNSFCDSSVEELRLNFLFDYAEGESTDQGYKITRIGEIIGRFKCLKRLYLKIDYECPFKNNFSLCSTTLETIQFYGSGVVDIRDLDCPHLKHFKSNKFRLYMVDFEEMEAFKALKKVRFGDFPEDYCGGSFDVPDDCIFEWKYSADGPLQRVMDAMNRDFD
uniref:Uncharacterized protein n=1 Tax=Chaetoceros debilis TaxID=122233 RepID=A0A7S3PUK9_9STRA|mmetsp:Transcript_10431/g.15806  ORF Transcript_10431/g.15806 Transcript_10431/m.15806 type:complete len:415 (+) Transcript_10431:624-1868(+)